MTREEIIDFCEMKSQLEPENEDIFNYIIKALEQEPCEDVVSRQSVKEGMIKYGFHAPDMTVTEFIEDMLSPVTPTQRWIPVSERLPEEYITVIGTTEFDDIYKTELYDDCGERKWYANGDYDVPIVAWMPLPEPYKAESEDKE